MSQSNPTISGDTIEQPGAKSAAAKSNWGRTLALTGLFLTIVGLFMGGLFKDNPTGTTVLRFFFIGGLVCLLVGLTGVGINAMRKRGNKASA